jgi:hypothetical protein
MNNGNGTFAAAVSYDTGYHPQAVAAADFNGDGKPDIVAGNTGTTISVLMNNGDGTFAAAVNYTVASGPVSIAVGNLFGDSKPEIVTVANDVYNGTINVLKNNGNGTFAAAVSFSVGGRYTNSVALGDFYKDGKLDIAVTSASGSVVSILKNNGAGAFAAAVTYTGIAGADSVAVGDLNSDGYPDLVAADSGPFNSTISVLKNHSDGTFESPVTYDVCNSPSAIAIKDLDGDGHQDIVVANWGDHTVSVLFNAGTGAFGPAKHYNVGYCPGSIVLTDVNKDGKPDIVVAVTNMSTVSVLLNRGGRTFRSSDAYTVNDIKPKSVATGDLNGDGKPDMVAGNNNKTLSVLMNKGNGALADEIMYTLTLSGYGASLVALGDVNGDGKLDIVAANNGSDNISVLKNNGDGTFAAAVNYSVGPYPSAIALGNIDGDTDLDVVVANNGGSSISVLKNNGTGAFAAAVNYSVGAYPSSVALGDIDGDGDKDIVVSSYSDDNISVLKNNGTGAFAAAVNYIAGNAPQAIALGDIDGDVDLDIVIGLLDGTVSILKNNGSGSFAATVTYSVGIPGYLDTLSMADINMDGHLDIIVAFEDESDALIEVFLNKGDGTFGLPLPYFMGTYHIPSIAVADFDSSGKPDIAASLNRVVGVLFAVDTKPNSFSFIPQTGVTADTIVISNSITVSGINTPSPISVTGGEYSINGGAFRSVAGKVFKGDSVRVRLTSSGSALTMTTATLTIGGIKRAFNVTTE